MELLLEMLRGMVGESREAVPLYRQVRAGGLDRALVGQMKRFFSDRAEFLNIYREQLARWRKEPLTPLQRQRVEEGEALVEEGTRLNSAFEEMAERAIPIEDIMEMSDLEVGLKVVACDLPRAGEQLFKKPAPSPTPPEPDEEDAPGLEAFRSAMDSALDAYLAGIERWACDDAGLAAERRALGRRAATMFLESLRELTQASEAEGVRIVNRVLKLLEWIQASTENRRFFDDEILGARDPERRWSAVREVGQEMGLSPPECEELANLLDASARVTFGEAFPPGFA